MAYNYDKLYGETQDALGAPTAVFVDFFDTYDPTGARVLDVGCGQGRDALFIARKGHRVVGVDLSQNGIRDMLSAARTETLAITGFVADVLSYRPDGTFDVILVDRTLHMLPEADRLAVLTRLLDHVSSPGWVLIADEASNIAGFERVFADHRLDWTTVHKKSGYLFMQRG